MSGGSFRMSRRPDAPRRVRGGLKLRNPEPAPRGPIARRWLELLETLVPEARRLDGLDYARRGQATGLDLGAGLIEARVQGRATAPYLTRWQVATFTEAAWQAVIEAMAAEALYAAKLLAGELPPEIDEVFAARGLALIPAAEEVSLVCDCPASGPCKHVAALGYLAVERLDQDPLAILRLRGGPDVLERLAAARAFRSHGHAAAHAEPVVGGVPQAGSLDADLERFWRPGPELAGLRKMPPPRHAPHALLRRLGPSPLEGRFPMIGLLASIYDTVSRAAVRLRDRAEGIGGD